MCVNYWLKYRSKLCLTQVWLLDIDGYSLHFKSGWNIAQSVQYFILMYCFSIIYLWYITVSLNCKLYFQVCLVRFWWRQFVQVLCAQSLFVCRQFAALHSTAVAIAHAIKSVGRTKLMNRPIFRVRWSAGHSGGICNFFASFHDNVVISTLLSWYCSHSNNYADYCDRHFGQILTHSTIWTISKSF